MGERERGREGDMERGIEGERERGREGEREREIMCYARGCENISVTRNGTPTMQQNMRLCRLSKSPLLDRTKGNGLERAIQHYEELTSKVSDLVPSDEHAF